MPMCFNEKPNSSGFAFGIEVMDLFVFFSHMWVVEAYNCALFSLLFPSGPKIKPPVWF